MTEVAFKQRFLPLHQVLYNSAWNLTHDSDDAQDLVQDVYLKMWSRRDELAVIDNDRAYCIKTLKNIFLNRFRNNRLVKAEIEPETLNIADSETNADDWRTQHLLKIIGELTEPAKTVITMRDLNQAEVETIAEATGMSQTNVRVVLSRTRKKIKEHFIHLISNE